MDSLLKLRKFEVVREHLTAPDGSAGTREFVMHPGAVVILPLLSDGRCVMIRQFRPALGIELWELPAGTLDVPGESPHDAAARELEEEAGYRAGTISHLCEFYTSPGILSERITAFVAGELTSTRQKLGPTEQIEVEPLPTAEVLEMVRDGRIVDGKTIITLLRWQMHRGFVS